MRESRDQGEQEARRLSALIAQKPGAIATAIRLHGRRAEKRGESRLAERWRKWLRSVYRLSRT